MGGERSQLGSEVTLAQTGNNNNVRHDGGLRGSTVSVGPLKITTVLKGGIYCVLIKLDSFYIFPYVKYRFSKKCLQVHLKIHFRCLPITEKWVF